VSCPAISFSIAAAASRSYEHVALLDDLLKPAAAIQQQEWQQQRQQHGKNISKTTCSRGRECVMGATAAIEKG